MHIMKQRNRISSLLTSQPQGRARTVPLLVRLTFVSQILLSSLLLSLSSSSPSTVVLAASWNINYDALNPKNIMKNIRKKTTYTPLLFFTVPKGLMKECDEMEKVICTIEKECNVRVERMDVLRNPANEVLLELLSTSQSTTQSVTKNPPFLYNRESLQTYTIPTTTSSTGNEDGSNKAKRRSTTRSIYIDKNKVRAWAKGRYLKASLYQPKLGISGNVGSSSTDQKVDAPTVNTNDNSSNNNKMMEDDQIDMLEDLALTPEQRKGKRLIKERTEALKNKS